MALLGYTRVSTLHQSPDMQIKALTEAGAERIWTDRMSGARDDRPELAALLDYARRGDVLMVWRLDRLGRSLPHLLTVADDLQGRGVELRSLTEAIDTTTPGGRLIFHVFGAVAEFERAIAAERTAAGVAAARAAGRHPGRPGLTADTAAAVQALDKAGTPRAQIARTLGISRSSVYRSLSAPQVVGTPVRREFTPQLDISIPGTFDDPLPEAEIAEWEGSASGEGTDGL
ncbi:Putative resolvase/invertase/recombinase [Mycobacteroides abscessus subsp. massiliense]|uniref:Site-specific DNA recombinase n=1 Tax=Mycolicibacterium fortuitum subsp. acetamidolyticum TaxID=144550 RepID=A0A100WYN2_MYCFO|nr:MULTISPECIES: recombinase family protein [Mycobacteriaceae]GAT06514.1 site-specific DNA recombinase [Mycolicibacterium fortuitum subsp. acetamidolyticum]MCV7143866.1 recombinase family protein [Mycolicibacterium fortuitum]SKM23120.1 Putative resolvase/invertase/recombinase [Mycobacteroides abscessus subsp. abscessus]SKM87396.1 Putative resolvase/invertase/recombinase [Mycobacteroides abscessus subsp. massiliense]SKN98891.1 Putative resolvase/invertase/recombinase [Mycobacteroides abscessus 